MKKTIYLHIGLPKTGTSSIQSFAYANHNELKMHGVLYPIDSTRSYMSGNAHHNIAREAFDNGIVFPSKTGMQDLIEDIEKAEQRKILLSTEEFSAFYINEKRVSNLKSYLSDHDVKIIIYLRRQDEWIISMIQEKSKFGKNHFKSFSSEEIFKIGLKDFILKYFRLIKRWSNIFGENSIILRIFDKTKWKQGNLITDFFDCIGINAQLSEFKQVGILNEKMSLELFFYLERLNKFIKKIPTKGLKPTQRDSLLENRIRRDFIKHVCLDTGKMDELFIYEDRVRLMDYFSDENTQAAEVFLKEKRLFSPINKDKYLSLEVERKFNIWDVKDEILISFLLDYIKRNEKR